MGEVKEGAPAGSGCTPRALHVPHSPDELRLWLLAGLVLPEATPRRWLHPREMVVRGNTGLKGGGDPPKHQRGTVTNSVTSSYFLSSASFCRRCRALTKAVGSKRGWREPGRGGRGGGHNEEGVSRVLSPLLDVCPKCPIPAGDRDFGEGRPRLLLWLSRDAERCSWRRGAGLADFWLLPRGPVRSEGDRRTPHGHEGPPAGFTPASPPPVGGQFSSQVLHPQMQPLL